MHNGISKSEKVEVCVNVINVKIQRTKKKKSTLLMVK